MKLYHGTNRDFDQIDLLKSKPNKDFGRGFYLSADYQQALNMAQVKVEQLESGTPIVQKILQPQRRQRPVVLGLEGVRDYF